MISIIIPTKNEEKYIVRTLRALSTLATMHEVIVSDGGSTDRTVALARPLATRVVVNTDEPRTIAHGKNCGAAVATGEWFVFIDADVTIPNGDAFFAHIFDYATAHPNLVGVTVPIRVEPNLATRADKIFFGMLNLQYRFLNNVLRVGNASGEFQMIRRDAFWKVGGYRADFAAGEDNEMFAQLARIGETHFFAGSGVRHSGRRARALGWPRLLYAWIKNGLWVLLFRKSAYAEWKEIR